MGSSIKVTLRKKANKQGLFPLAVRITKNRKTTYLYIGHYIAIKYWDEGNREVRKSHPNSIRLNNLLIKKLAEANQTLIDLQTHQNDISSKQIARVGHFIRFVDNDDLSFREIDEALLRRFSLYLKTTRKVSQRSVINNLIVIRTLYNKAIRLGIVDRKLYPFGADKIRIKFPESEKVGLTIEEIQSIEALEGLTEQQSHARNVWLFSFYLAGMRVGDVLMIKWSDIYDGRLHYRMGKNEKLLSFKLPEKITSLLRRYYEDRRSSEDFVFPEMNNADLKNPKDVFNKVKTANKKFNKYLVHIAEKAKINKKLTMHIARHSFGNISGDRIPIQMLQKLYRHSTVTTTINYQANFMHKETDDALEKVINF